MQKKYEVIRFIKQGEDCRIIQDYVLGETMAEFLKRHPHVKKEKLFLWIHQLIDALICVSEQDVPCYGYLSPYSIVFKNADVIFLLNVNEMSAKEKLSHMKESNKLHLFLNKGQYDEFYAFGRTLQFLLTKANVSPPFSKLEEVRLRRIISKCLSDNSRKKYQKFSDIKSDFPTKKRKKKIRLPILLGVVFMIVIVLGGGLFLSRKINSKESELHTETVRETDDVYIELGMLHFFMANDFVKSKELFLEAEKNVIASAYARLSEFMSGDVWMVEEEVLQILNELEEMAGEEYLHQGCMFRVYGRLNSEEARRKTIEIGMSLLENEIEKEIWMNEERRHEVKKGILNANLELKNYESAIQYCEDSSVEEKILIMARFCKDEMLSKGEKERYLISLLKTDPEIVKEETFIRLQTEYGIKMEGEKIWLEN